MGLGGHRTSAIQDRCRPPWWYDLAYPDGSVRPIPHDGLGRPRMVRVQYRDTSHARDLSVMKLSGIWLASTHGTSAYALFDSLGAVGRWPFAAWQSVHEYECREAQRQKYAGVLRV